jgi:hypothetical protein
VALVASSLPSVFVMVLFVQQEQTQVGVLSAVPTFTKGTAQPAQYQKNS